MSRNSQIMLNLVKVKHSTTALCVNGVQIRSAWFTGSYFSYSETGTREIWFLDVFQEVLCSKSNDFYFLNI